MVTLFTLVEEMKNEWDLTKPSMPLEALFYEYVQSQLIRQLFSQNLGKTKEIREVGYGRT